MIDLVFFTTNDVKLAHFQHLAMGSAFRVIGFRRKSYYASYHEPRTKDRDALLQESYASALIQWKRTHKGRDSGFFFLEDTSVRIDALSASDEIPGVDVKYWMKEITFDRLDKRLRELNDNRRASVRSDIVLHIPSDIREGFGLKAPFAHFHGITQGSIVRRDIRFPQNKVFPWLDNRTFNRWFIPDGFDLPISRLKINSADTVDFRKRAFESMLAFLAKLGVKGPSEQENGDKLQLTLPSIPNEPCDFIICGPSCAGKSTLANYLASNYQYSHLEASDFMYKAFWQRHGPSTRINIGDFAEDALRVQPSIVADQVKEQIEDENPRAFAVTGFRAPKEVERLLETIGKKRRVQLVYVDASAHERFQRARRRQRDGEKIKLQEFERREKQELRMGLRNIESKLDRTLISNNSTRQKFFLRFRNIFSKDLRLQRKSPLPPWPSLPRHDLENLILITLSQKRCLNKSFTTSEIAKLMNARLAPVGRKVEKDNVSRYFNQNFYPYYEIRIEQRKRKYKLSNTGLARARLLKNAGFSYSLRSRPTRSRSVSLFYDQD